jgi:hydrogenase maturation protease
MDVLKMLELMEGHLPPVVIVGVEPGKIEVGLELTPEVAASLPFVLELVTKEISS